MFYDLVKSQVSRVSRKKEGFQVNFHNQVVSSERQVLQFQYRFLFVRCKKKKIKVGTRLRKRTFTYQISIRLGLFR